MLAEKLLNIFGKSCSNKMADFITNKRIETVESFIAIDAGLPVGRYIFQLTVVDSNGNISKPSQIQVQIIRPLIIGPVIAEPISLVRLIQ